MTAAAHKLVEELKGRARRAFLSASKQADDFGRRFVEHGAWCYANAALELEAALAPEQLDVTTLQTPAQATACALPAIGANWQGGLYAGITTNPQGELYALVLLGDKPTSPLKWKAAMGWAADLNADLPNRVEGALLFANLRDKFEPEWHWTNEQYAGYESFAWFQDFYYGDQLTSGKSDEGRARAVRRLPINPSILQA